MIIKKHIESFENLRIASPSEIKTVQENALKSTLSYVQKNSPYYRRLFHDNDINIDTITSIEDLVKIPVSTKNDIQINNRDLLCIPKKDIIDYVVTSGSLGSPLTVWLNESDLNRLAVNEYLSMKNAGCTNEDVFQLMTTMDKQFIAGMAYFSGVRMLGAGIIRMGPGKISAQWESIFNNEVTVLICVPSFILSLLDYAIKNGLNYQNSNVKKIICIGQNIRNDKLELNIIGQKIKQHWDVELYSTYASTEMQAAFTECQFGQGGHYNPGLLIIECLDDNDLPVTEGEVGELTITTLDVEATPLVRFKTGDLCRLNNDKCQCGSNTTRISPIIGRKQQMMKVKGTTIFPKSIYEILNKFDSVQNYLIEIDKNDIGEDRVNVIAGTSHQETSLQEAISKEIKNKLRVSIAVELRRKEEVHRMQYPNENRKPKLFLDYRQSLT